MHPRWFWLGRKNRSKYEIGQDNLLDLALFHIKKCIMFESLELFIGQVIDIETLLNNLAAFNYKNVKRALIEGEFSQRGEILDVYPVNFDGPVRIDFDDEKISRIASINLRSQKSIWQHKIIIILPFHKKKKEDVFTSDIPLNNFVDIQKGDYVVHNNHGIGRFLGIKEFDISDSKKEHLIIEYKDGDKLYVPKHDMRLVQKYVSFNKKPPRLFKLGSKEWHKVRIKIQKRLQMLAAELLHTQALRASLKGHLFSEDTQWQKEFENAFPYTETDDQIKATLEVKQDMESLQPMDRLLCGDVGYGKTEVALRAAFKAVMDNKQVAVLVPTTILAEQHFYNFSHRMKDFPIKVAMLSRFRTKSEQVGIIKDLKDGKVDIVIGTHRLISKDIFFKDLGLIIIDEEQRFGVKAKERLKHLRVLADVLTLTATPIPRTLHMALTGARDMSIITTPPQNRIPIKTEIVEFDEDLIKKAIQRELKRKGQVFFLHNRVEDIEQIARIVNRLSESARIGIAHGQMSPKVLEDIMIKFLDGAIDVLVCTTIIGSGIDIPNANTLIVNRADNFGLADLHQLRGRVGRSDVKSYAYFIVPPKKILSSIAKARLEAIEKFCGLGAGFKIAFEDMQLRGAGNLLGGEQHGYITSIGFDLYCRLLKESVENLKLLNEGTANAANI
ncbi:MAG: transcription-repair coupling factor [Omnitrophica WOR_2 bacterium GWF2_38_59]|nr:MAG: transcription-repair coupling factor [Omnitrophica WOR_2 bacterium GWF2_38_59]OGX48417.1 MAG: transcription-repair coupling factor [Omnitrophica WOR_2 bacterium RIFOXYA2_FULL_38_17]OGX53072.1 MAG: transcription-repair coupling factor [Omnitrophica WOR_2 bacterium RIFOXYA12_FULL_38_10]OGX55849.1 MAG: transcription-repair coupling factor [Omnitrophica WOR_2 bacterium RIFOXYC2_FULL_38_12]OGX56922.1 MAG: transcription-repair coupling factor [Omnitrophica WOR_2 bacterium RIFOXYB2_FULL_38_16]